MKKETRTDWIETTIDGVVYRGMRSIEGTRKLFQTIYYAGGSRFDGHRYNGYTSSMDAVAKIILAELVREAKTQNS